MSKVKSRHGLTAAERFRAEYSDPVQRSLRKRLLVLLRAYTGIAWEWCDGDKEVLGVSGNWQLMTENPMDEGPFWLWHLEHSPQWFDNPHEAVTSLLDSYRRFAIESARNKASSAGTRPAS